LRRRRRWRRVHLVVTVDGKRHRETWSIRNWDVAIFEYSHRWMTLQ
jgi:hypothetical protein